MHRNNSEQLPDLRVEGTRFQPSRHFAHRSPSDGWRMAETTHEGAEAPASGGFKVPNDEHCRHSLSARITHQSAQPELSGTVKNRIVTIAIAGLSVAALIGGITIAATGGIGISPVSRGRFATRGAPHARLSGSFYSRTSVDTGHHGHRADGNGAGWRRGGRISRQQQRITALYLTSRTRQPSQRSPVS